MAVAGVRIEIGMEVRRQAQVDVAVARMQRPTARNLRAVGRFRFDAAVARFQIQSVEPAAHVDAAIAGIHVERAIEIRSFDVAIAGMHADIPAQAAGAHVSIAGIHVNASRNRLQCDVSVAGVHIEIQLARNPNFHTQERWLLPKICQFMCGSFTLTVT